MKSDLPYPFAVNLLGSGRQNCSNQFHIFTEVEFLTRADFAPAGEGERPKSAKLTSPCKSASRAPAELHGGRFREIWQNSQLHIYTTSVWRLILYDSARSAYSKQLLEPRLATLLNPYSMTRGSTVRLFPSSPTVPPPHTSRIFAFHRHM